MAAPVIPVGVTMATIAWLWTATIGDETTVPSGLTVTFDPAPEWLQYIAAAPHMTIAPWSVTGTIDTTDGTLRGPDGTANVTLLPTDDTDLNPSAWTYQVTVRQGSRVLMDFPIAAPGGATTDLADVTPIASSTGNAVVMGPPWVADGTEDGQVPTWDAATGTYIPSAQAAGGVSSVNAKTGDVTLTAADVGAQAAGSYATAAQGAKADTAVQPTDLATVATTGSYSDLGDKPTIPAASTAVATLTAAASAGTVTCSLFGDRVVATIDGLTTTGSAEAVATLPAGFVPDFSQGHGWLVDSAGEWWAAYVSTTQLLILGPPPSGTVLSGSLTWKAA